MHFNQLLKTQGCTEEATFFPYYISIEKDDQPASSTYPGAVSSISDKVLKG